ncbi:MurT ligase domain-containing protein [Paraeggerthella sp.]|uniref:MurT ligase domain-containing protein n=1 Tax=Paraeggerthella sp. TaxID=2897350 RepID=UPI003AB4DCF8
MGLQFAAARAVSAVSTWGLKNVFHRPAANFPGKIALYVDPRIIADLTPKLAKGSVAVVGTNGKTTVTNLLADVLEQAGQRVVCNRTGANLDSGVATALLHAGPSDWGVFETDELWLAKILPHLKANYVVLLNLFRDQLDRVGEIDRIQDSIVGALASSPDTVLVYNADDPLCAMIAERAENRSIAFGVAQDMGLPQNTVADATMCQRCSSMFEYAFRQYGQLGDFHCPTCGFSRASLDFAAEDVRLSTDGLSFQLGKPQQGVAANAGAFSVRAPFSGAYMVYNLAAVGVAASLLGCSNDALQQAIDAFDPQNGRLQSYEIAGRSALLNLAKNPTGFNQNLKIILQDEGPKAVAFFVNDKEGDGRDISWLWDIDFEELAAERDLLVFAGGIRRNDLQVRLKYAGLDAQLIDDAHDLFGRLSNVPAEVKAYLIANYTALPPVHADMDALAAAETAPSAGAPGASGTLAAADASDASQAPVAAASAPSASRVPPAADPSGSEAPLVIAHLFPDLLNLYGDGGNVRILERRLRDRGVAVEVKRVNHGQSVDLADVDLVFLGGGPDREQRLASTELMRMRDELRAFVEDDGVLLAICGGYQILGKEWLLGDEVVEGLGIVDMTTERAAGSADRLIDNIVLDSPLAQMPVVGYENHAGRTRLGAGVQAFGRVVSSVGHGNNDDDKQDGVLYKNVVGTYLHGPLLAKNPQVADALLARALERRAARAEVPAPSLAALDDTAEKAANEYLCKRLNVRV